jgi:hypothetical protein
LKLKLKINLDNFIIFDNEQIWIHPDLGYHLAMWLSPDLAVEINEYIKSTVIKKTDKILQEKKNIKENYI